MKILNKLELKIVAIITMFIDHISYILHHNLFTNLFGRFAFPIYAFCIADGYKHTSNYKKYLTRLLIFALISSIPHYLFMNKIGHSFGLNIFFTLFLGLLCCHTYTTIKNKYLKWFLIIIISLFATLTKCEYEFYGVLTILTFYIFSDKKILTTIIFSLLTIIYYFYSYIIVIPNFNIANKSFLDYMLFAPYAILSLLCIFMYNGKPGKSNKILKYIFYIFYPIHLLILYLI